MHQRPNPIHFFFQREMARVEKMELCTGNIFFKEFSSLHRKDSIVFAPSDQRRGLLFMEILLPIGIDIQIESWISLFPGRDVQPLHVKRAIENGRRNRVRHLNSPSAREML